MEAWVDFLTTYYGTLKPPECLPDSIEWLFPQKDEQVRQITGSFFKKFYNDEHQRTLCLGINPGRFGAGVTGVNFTAPRQLEKFCGIRHPFKNQTELSAEFIYDVIEQYGGVTKFYYDFFIGAVCPLGFIRNGKNLNYYDDKQLLETVEPFIVENIYLLASFNVNRETCICIGGEKNFRFLSVLNSRHQWFRQIAALPHPRFIMQYKRKYKQEFIDQYLHVLQS